MRAAGNVKLLCRLLVRKGAALPSSKISAATKCSAVGLCKIYLPVCQRGAASRHSVRLTCRDFCSCHIIYVHFISCRHATSYSATILGHFHGCRSSSPSLIAHKGPDLRYDTLKPSERKESTRHTSSNRRCTDARRSLSCVKMFDFDYTSTRPAIEAPTVACNLSAGRC